MENIILRILAVVIIFLLEESHCYPQQNPFGNNFGFFWPFFGQGQQGQQGGFNPFNPYGFSSSPFQSNSPSSEKPNNPSFSSNPFNNPFQGFGWPYGSQNQGSNGGSNPFFGNNQFNQNPFFNQYQNNVPTSQQPQGTSGSPPSPPNNNNQGQQNYPFGFPFANPFFPQYAQQQTTPLPAETPQIVKNPNAPNRPNQFPTTQDQKSNGNQSTQGIPMPDKGVVPNVPKETEAINNAQPVELEVEHSKQDTKHPSLITPEIPVKTPETLENDEQFENKLDLQARNGLPSQAEETNEDEDENSILDSQEEALIFN